MRLGLGLAVVLCGLALLGTWMLPRYFESDAFGARLRAAVREQLGGELRYSESGFALGSRQLSLRAIEIQADPSREEPLLRAPGATMELALLPLFSGRVVLVSFHAWDAEIRLTRRAGGWWPRERPGDGQQVADESLILLPLRVELLNASIWIEDERASPSEPWRFEAVDLIGRAKPARGGLEVRGKGRIHEGGDLELSGELGPDRGYTLRARLDGAELASLARLWPLPARGGLSELSGELAAVAELTGELGSEGQLRIEFAVSEAEAQLGGLRLRAQVTGEREGWSAGPLSFVVELDRGGRLSGRGDWDDEGVSNFVLELSSVAAAPFLPVVPDAQALSGTLSGDIRHTPSPGAAHRFRVRLGLGESVLQLEGVRFAGMLKIAAELEADEDRVGSIGLRGRFDLDARLAELDYAGVFHKPAGLPALVSGDLQLQPGRGLELRNLHLKLHGFEGQLGRASDAQGSESPRTIP